MKMLISSELGCVYRLNGDQVLWASMMRDDSFDTDDFSPVDEELVGEERVSFQGQDTNLSGVFEQVRQQLR